MARSQRPDRPSPVTITDSLARFVFNLLGWSLTADPTASRTQLRQRSAPEIAKALGCSFMLAEEHFDTAVEFWIEHAALDRSGVALDEAVVFVHQSLAEFGAGRYAADFEDDRPPDFSPPAWNSSPAGQAACAPSASTPGSARRNPEAARRPVRALPID